MENKKVEWLTENEQYEPKIGYEKIMRIKDLRLRSLRLDFNTKRAKAFEDERNIPDHLLGEAWDKIDKEEEKALIEYKNNLKKDNY